MAHEYRTPSPCQRRTRTPASSFPSIFSILVILISISSSVLAFDMEHDGQAHQSEAFKRLAREGQIHVDQRGPPTVLRVPVEKRQESSAAVTSTELVSSSDRGSTPTSTTPPSVTIITTPLPSPFDTSLGSNFTSQACPDYFSTFLSNTTFRSCIPVSLLLQNSNSFFRAERDSSLLSETLDAACNAPVALCTPLLQSIAADLISSDNCGADFQQQNPLVSQAYAGLMAYEPVYRATCLRDPMTGAFCFSEAITDATSASDAYPYYTALGLMLPKGSRPTCSQCLQNTMAIFAQYAGNSSQPLSSAYVPCAQQINAGCGSRFVNATVQVVTSGATAGSVDSPILTYVAALAITLCALF